VCDHPDRETAMTVLSRHDDGTPAAWCDPCLAPLVSALNMGGLPTVASCCGHGRRPGSVVLADGRELLVLPDQEAARTLDGLWPDINQPPLEDTP